jgi:hypothetical protein
VWSWRRDPGATCGSSPPALRGQERPFPEESAKQAAKPLRGEGRDASAVPVKSVCVLYTTVAHGAAGAASARPSPRPLIEEGANEMTEPGRKRVAGMLDVVPANAGTHTPRRKLLHAMPDGFSSTTMPCGYGSLRSQGRQLGKCLPLFHLAPIRDAQEMWDGQGASVPTSRARPRRSALRRCASNSAARWAWTGRRRS